MMVSVAGMYVMCVDGLCFFLVFLYSLCVKFFCCCLLFLVVVFMSRNCAL